MVEAVPAVPANDSHRGSVHGWPWAGPQRVSTRLALGWSTERLWAVGPTLGFLNSRGDHQLTDKPKLYLLMKYETQLNHISKCSLLALQRKINELNPFFKKCNLRIRMAIIIKIFNLFYSPITVAK